MLKITKEDLDTVVECLTLPSMSQDKLQIITKFIQNVSVYIRRANRGGQSLRQNQDNLQ